MENIIDESNLKLFDRLLIPFKKFRSVFSIADTYGKIAMLIQVILLGFGPLVLGQIEFGLLLVVLIYALGFGFGYIASGYFSGVINITPVTFIVVSLILLAAIIALWYVTFSKTIKLVEDHNKGEPIFNSFIFNVLVSLFNIIKNWFKEFSTQFKVGDKKVKTLLPLSFFLFGVPLIAFNEVVKGLAFLLIQLLGTLYLIARGISDLVGFFSLGQDHDFEAPVVYGVIALIVIALLVFFYITQLNATLKAANDYNIKKLGPDFKKQLYNVIDKNFYVTALFVPILGAIIFTIIPLIFMIMLAFTNRSNQIWPGYSTTASTGFLEWVGLESFRRIFADGANLQDLLSVFAWTMIWALLATFSCFFGGLLLAMLINKKSIKIKPFFRSLFVVAMAMPQFVSLLVMKSFFMDYGPLQTLLSNMGVYFAQGMGLWDQEFTARMLIIFINMWVGIPYYMLLMSGLLINIPKGYYEAAKISGASRWKQFTRITFPNIMFMTAPMLITSFVSNINNFNVIWFLTNGYPANDSASGTAGKTDILITWLYKLSWQRKDFNFGSAIGIIMFVITATLSLVVFRNTSSYKNEEEYR